MLVYEAKLKGKPEQNQALDEAIRTGQFIRNSCLRYWMDNHDIGKTEMFRYNTQLRNDPQFPWAKQLNSHACQASVERAGFAITRFYDNCKKGKPGKKGYPKFKKNTRSVEYKTSGWKLNDVRDRITFSDGFKAGTFKLIGSRDLNYYQLSQIKRVRVVKRCDGYYAQFCIKHDRQEFREAKGQAIGLDVGIMHFYTDSNGATVDCPKFLRKSERQLKRLQRNVSKKFKRGQPQSNSYKKARNRLARKHLQVSRQRKDWVVKLARCVVMSNDIVVYEDLQVQNLVKNHCLAKSIHDASWSMFRQWVEYFGKVFGVQTLAVAPHYTSQECSACGTRVQKSLSTRTHQCQCGCELDRDQNAAINILSRAGHARIHASGENHLCQLGESLSGKWTR